MKIAFIYDVIYPYVKGGAEKRNWELARRLAAKGHEIHIFGVKSWDGPRCIMDSGVYLHGVSRPRSLYLGSGRRSIRQVLFFSVSIIAPLLVSRFDIIDCCAFPYLPFFAVRIISWFKKIPLVVTWQEVWGDYWYDYLGPLKGIPARGIETAVIKFADNIIVHSGKVKEELIANGMNRMISVIPHGADFELIDDAPAAAEAPDLIFSGRLIRDKNTDILVKAVARIKETLAGIKCFIIGEGPEKKRLLELRNGLGLEKNIVFMDFQPYRYLISMMKASKIFILPSQREGFAIAVIEALACGLPVITVRHPMNAAVGLIRDGENGLISDLNPCDIANKSLALLQNDPLRKRFSAAAKKSAEGYDWDSITSRYEDFYFRLLKQGY